MAATAFLRAASLAGAVALLSGGAGRADAQDANGRYSMAPTTDGYLKLDSRTGAVTHCQREGAAYRCTLVPDERNALQDEIDRLSRENAQLKDRLAAAGGNSASPPPAAGAPPPSSLPSEEEVDRALSLMERFLRRFRDVMKEPEDGKPL